MPTIFPFKNDVAALVAILLVGTAPLNAEAQDDVLRNVPASRAPEQSQKRNLALDRAPLVDQSRGKDVAASKKAPLLVDRGFGRYIDDNLILKAWQDLDAALMADVALLLTEAEEALRRPHKPFTARNAMSVAVRMATLQGDKESLQRLAESASRRSDQRLQGQLAQVKKLSGSARMLDEGLGISLGELDVGQFSYLKDLMHGVRRAQLTEDSEAVEKWIQVTRELDLFAPDLRKRITAALKEVEDELTDNGDDGGPAADATSAIDKLDAASRATITFQKLICNEQEGIIWPDRPRLVIIPDGGTPYSFGNPSMETGEQWVLDATFSYVSHVKVKLYDDDALDPDDFLGEVIIRPGAGRGRARFDRDPNGTGCLYTLVYD